MPSRSRSDKDGLRGTGRLERQAALLAEAFVNPQEPLLEERVIGSQRYQLRQHSAYISAIYHLSANGMTHLVAYNDRPQTDWSEAANHSAKIEATGNCDGAIAVKLSSTGKVHRAWIGRSYTNCGLSSPGGVVRFRIGCGDLSKDLGLIDCIHCRRI
jgi:hypothetical protein